MPRSLLALFIVLAGCGSNLGHPASRVQLPSAQRVDPYPITTVPRTPDPLPPHKADLEHYRGKGHSESSMRTAQAIVSPCPDTATSPPIAIPPSTPYALSFTAPADFDLYRVTVGGVQQPWAGVLVKSGPVVEGGCYTWQTSGTFLSPSTPGTYNVVLTTLTADLASESAAALTTMVVGQPTGCTYALSAPGQSFTAAGGSGNVAVTTTAPCAWTSLSGAPSWLTIPTGSGTGTGSGSMVFTVAANTATTGRTGILTIAGQAFTVGQAGVPTGDPCGPLGADRPALTILRWGPSPIKAGARAYVLYQMASRTPILEVVVKVNDAPVNTVPSYTDDGATWFDTPAAKGTYKLAVSARNGICPAVEKVSSVNLVTK